MHWIERITPENFNSSFNLKDILSGSVCYPASGIDGRALIGLVPFSGSYVNIDYSIPREKVEHALRNDFENVGYSLLGLTYIPEVTLTPMGFEMHYFPATDSELAKMNFVKQSRQKFTPFALWAVFELNETMQKKSGKRNRFSILHIGGEACATFDALYVGNGINPLAVAILNPGEGYGDNWTSFSKPEYRFFKLIEYNVIHNKAVYPGYVMTNLCLWPGYKEVKSSSEGWRLYERINQQGINE